MKLRKIFRLLMLTVIFNIAVSQSIYAQTTITLDDQGFVDNELIAATTVISGFTFSNVSSGSPLTMIATTTNSLSGIGFTNIKGGPGILTITKGGNFFDFQSFYYGGADDIPSITILGYSGGIQVASQIIDTSTPTTFSGTVILSSDFDNLDVVYIAVVTLGVALIPTFDQFVFAPPPCISVSPPAGTTNTWMGCVDNDWANGANWSTGVSPTASDIVYVPNNPDNILIINQVVTCSKIIVEIGGICKIDYNAGGKLIVKFD